MADKLTVEAYAARMEEFAAAYNKVRPPFLSRLGKSIKPGARVLDIGCGSARDLAALAEEGFEAWGVEPVAEFRSRAERDFPALKGRIHAGALPDQIPEDLGMFDAVHCAAVLMHLPTEELFNAVFSIRDLLRPGGVAHFSYCPDRPDLDAHNRSPEGRLYNPINPSQLVAILSRAGFEKLSEETADDAMGRAGIRWVSLIVRRIDEPNERPLQRIEQILNHDSKDASYKLALLRSLAELAGSRFHEAKWIDNGMVAIPVGLVVDQWIRYYWPVFASPTFIAQKNGEEPGCRKPLAFRQPLSRLVDHFRDSGGYVAFAEASARNPSIARAARAKVRDAIRDGPVVFASGNLFGWRKIDGHPHITMPDRFWQEMAGLTHWIEPAIRLRWAEETRRFSKQRFQTGEILSILSTDYEEVRNVSEARAVFTGLKGLRCTWSGRDIKMNSLDVDHIIPFSLWRNNDLWNLVPAHRFINNSKRDRLVARDFLYKRRDPIVHAWELQRARMPERFDRELEKLMGRHADSRNWKTPAFNRLAEAIEATALRRQAERWSA